ncbi:uncharacterized protein LOC130743896 [Lotus japonicus]|uniref:uncharacterized protein LOC130743896 n=1 Tax=Lotus japonicus TaxID=34305 RepID=UPI002590866B|nr:uncharacterized protein LOC130743896 [Lotus japonicus]
MCAALCQVINSVPVVEGVDDSYVWWPEPSGVYTVQSAYKLLRAHTLGAGDPVFSLVWDSAAPSNVCGLIWRVILDQLQSKANLRKRGVIHSDEEARCSLCLQEEESTSHLLLNCPRVASVWARCYRWLGTPTVLPYDCVSHLQQHVSLQLNSKQNQLFRVIWFAVVWMVWGRRNSVIFKGASWVEDEVFDGIQMRVWFWLTGRVKGFGFSVYEWLSNPILCLQSVA